MVFAFLFGLSMDYEVFILSRKMPSIAKTCCTKPEQSNPEVVVPPNEYGTPKKRSALRVSSCAIREVRARMPPAKRPIPPRWRCGAVMMRREVHSATSGLKAWALTTLDEPV